MTTLGTVPHNIEVCYGSRLHCMIHGTDEPDTGAYRVCLECWHVYATSDELLAEHNRVGLQIALEAPAYGYDPGVPLPVTDPDDVTCCPHCTHDW